MIKIKTGDLIEAAVSGEVDTIMVGCNCFSTWGAGINLALKKKFPEMFDVDRFDSRNPYQKIGNFCVKYGTPHFFGLYTQYDYGSDYRRF